jgi:uncharacterized protein YndB with AHSA1/START domain
MPSLPEHPPEWIAGAPTVVERTVEIGAPPESVWQHIADHERWPEWFAALAKVEVTGEGAGVGGRRRVTLKGAPGVDEVITAWDENEHFAFAVVATKIPVLAGMAESVRLEPTDDGCRVIYRQGLEPRRGCGWLMGPLSKRMSTQLAAGLAALKTRAEADPTA